MRDSSVLLIVVFPSVGAQPSLALMDGHAHFWQATEFDDLLANHDF
jgi:hypothetical protein